MADNNAMEVSQPIATQQDVEPSPGPAAFRFWKAIRAKQETLDLFLGHIFALKPHEGDVIRPYYQQGKLAGYIRTGSANLVEQDNVDLRAMRVNKEFRDAGSRLVYGRYIFHFKDAENCRWWTTHIGSQNFHNLRMLCVSMRSGWDLDCEIISTLDLCHEEQWQRFFSWLRHRHRLDGLILDFSNWDVVQASRRLTEERQAEVLEWREALLNKLSELRGFTQVSIVDPFEVAIAAAEKDGWSATLTQAREPPPPVHTTPTPLAQVLEHLRGMRRQRELRERLERKNERRDRRKQKRRARANAEAEADANDGAE
ncbi:uncharacterized protein PV07_09241 [Cladophialophora immunda]|uniref:Uncharacterized protein n=1 Tax=Cladophialophora immunda TaxID=569365 RepID=A0A0D2CR88_9EURO|nr:uncharacterized protein PV07_09241 [Cladophialophora immunda]KIW26114.1 hypothetical protein PV07_09241 [Cladophialophora immunda]